MFQKSAQILFAAALVALAATVGYALLHPNGADDLLAKARALIEARRPAQAVRELEMFENAASVQRDRNLRRELWRLRLRANSDLDNPEAALIDVENLLGDGLGDDESLQLERIRLLVDAHQGDRALQLARTFLATHEGHGRGLELAGEACREATAPLLTTLRRSLERDFGSDHARATEALDRAVYCADGDPEATRNLDVLAGLYAADARLSVTWPTTLRDIRSIRERVQEGLGYSLDSLTRNGHQTLAQRTVTAAWAAAGRYDDLAMQCEIHRRLETNEPTAEAGATAAWILARQGAYSAVLALADRWLPSAALARQIESKTVGKGVADLLLARVHAAWRIDDRANLQRLWPDLVALQKGGFEASVTQFVTIGLLHGFRNEYRPSDSALRHVTNLLGITPQPPNQVDLLPDIFAWRIEMVRGLGNSEDAELGLRTDWIKARPDDLRPRVELAKYLLANGKLPPAQAVLAEAAALAPDDGSIFLLQLSIATALDQQAGQGGEALLKQCFERRVLVPEVANPMGYLQCAQAAMGFPRFDVARECARMAVAAFPQQRLPRLLEIEACLKTNRATQAAELARRLAERVPPDAVTAWKTVEAHLAAGEPVEPVMGRAMVLCPPLPDLTRELLRSALANTESLAILFARPVLASPEAPLDLRLLAARAAAKIGNSQACARVLESIAQGSVVDERTSDDALLAAAAFVAAAARTTPDAELCKRTESLLDRFDVRGTAGPTALLQCAAAVEQTHPKTAYLVCARALVAADPESRNGGAHALAGRLAARNGDLVRAEEHWLAALAFRDGRAAAPDLARAWLASGRHDRALAALRLAEAPTDAALTAIEGNAPVAEALATIALGADEFDLLANATLALLGKASKVEWTHVPDSQRDLRFELLALLGSHGFGVPAVERAKEVVAADPASVTAQLLLARAQLEAGQFAEAAATHRSLAASRPALLWRELAIALRTPGYVLAPECHDALLHALATGACAGSTMATVAALQRITNAVVAGGDRSAADRSRALLWQQYPRAAFRPESDLAALEAMADDRVVWSVLDAALEDLGNDIRADLRTRMRRHAFARLGRLVERGAMPVAEACVAAVRHVLKDGPYGCALHFLLAHTDSAGALATDDSARLAMLFGHLDLVASGLDDDSNLESTVEQLIAGKGANATLAAIETTLQRRPTSVPMWHARAIVLAHMGLARAGIADLRGVLAHIHHPNETLAFATLAAFAGPLEPGDQQRLDGLAKEFVGSPEGMFARGVAHLRAGKPDDAVSLLSKAGARADGAHLYFLALACLESRDPKGAAQAHVHLERLARDYPRSSFARNAGNFASQLAPR